MALPTVAEVRAWCQIPSTSLSDAQLEQVMDGELSQQQLYCRWDGSPESYLPALAQALYRRVGRQVAGRGVPLGLVGDPASEAGAQRLATFDAEVERLEGPYRLVVFG